MKFQIKHIFPIAFAVLIPLLGFINSAAAKYNINTVQAWIFSAILIYAMWHGIWELRKLKATAKPGVFIIIAIIFTILAINISYLIGYMANQELQWMPVFRLVLLIIIILLIQYVLIAQENIANLKYEKEQLESEKLRAQLKELRTQVDPHFLFNSLNTLRSMVHQNHKNSEQFIIGLSDFFRQTLQHNENTTLPLSKELDVLRSYLFIMKSRNENAVQVNLDDIDEKYNNYLIPTLAIQSVIENCFKHNSMSTKMPLKITMQTVTGDYLEISNNIQPKLSDQETSGRGLDLLKKRYRLLKITDGINIIANETTFTVQLKLLPPE